MNEDEYTVVVEQPTWVKPCERCGEEVSRYRGSGDVICWAEFEGGDCGAIYNASGQRLRDDAPTFGVGGYWGPTYFFDPYDY